MSIAALSRLLPDLEIQTDREQTTPYRRDEACESAEAPVAVVFPRTTDDVVAIVQFAAKTKSPVVARGAGSGLSGAAVPMKNALVISFERMNRIVEIREDDFVAVVEPGVITGDLRRAVEARGLFYPPIPASVDFCTMGGNIATNAGGLCAVKYGVTREYVLGLEMVLPTGEVVETGGAFLKNSTGYNLTQLIVGSEGTLALVTKIIVKLIPLPKERATILVPFDSMKAVSETVVAILRERIVPPTLEIMPRAAIRAVLDRHPELSYPFPDAAASLLIELDGREGASLEASLMALQSVLDREAVASPQVATTASQREALWTVRKLIRESIAAKRDFVEADSVVPRKNVPLLIEAAEEISRTSGADVITYGHAGDGNLHTYFRPGTIPATEWPKRADEILTRFFQRTVELGGTISGEHGIGLLKKQYLPLALSSEQIALMKRIKRAFDPDDLFNPSKVFPE